MQKLFKAKSIFLFIVMPVISFSQQKNYGSWKIEAYSNSIIKVTHFPFEYSNNFNVTNAVIIKPIATISVACCWLVYPNLLIKFPIDQRGGKGCVPVSL